MVIVYETLTMHTKNIYKTDYNKITAITIDYSSTDKTLYNQYDTYNYNKQLFLIIVQKMLKNIFIVIQLYHCTILQYVI